MRLATILTVIATIVMALAGLVAAVPINDVMPTPPGHDDPDLSVDQVVDCLHSCNSSIINPRNSPEGKECLQPTVAKCCKHNVGDYHKYCRDGKYQPSSTCPSSSTVIDECMYAKVMSIYADMAGL